MFTTAQIEAITASVLRELASRGVAVGANPRSGTRQSSVSAVSPKSGDSGYVIADKVVTEDALVAAGAAGQTVSLPVGAIITPSGHD